MAAQKLPTPRVILCCIALKEEPYLDEWLIYNLYGVGFDAVEIYDNSPDNTLKGRFNEHGGRVNITHFPGRGQQIPAYNHMLRRLQDAGDTTTWVAFFDCDEFLVLKQHRTVQELMAAYDDTPGLYIGWYLFGDGHRTAYTAEPVTERFLYRQSIVHNHGKTIAKAGRMQSMQVHHGRCKGHPDEAVVDTSRRPLADEVSVEAVRPADVAVLHHYFGKTRPEFLLKRNRGNFTGKLRPHKDFDDHNFNEVFDDSAKHVYARALAHYRALKQTPWNSLAQAALGVTCAAFLLVLIALCILLSPGAPLSVRVTP